MIEEHNTDMGKEDVEAPPLSGLGLAHAAGLYMRKRH